MASFEETSGRGRELRALSPRALATVVLVLVVALVLAVLGSQSRPWTTGVELGHISNAWLRVVASLAVLFGLIVVALVAFLLWSGRPRLRRPRNPGDQPVYEPPESSRWEKLLLVSLALLLGVGPLVGGLLAAHYLGQRSTRPPAPGLTLAHAQPPPTATGTPRMAGGAGLDWLVLGGGAAALTAIALTVAVIVLLRRHGGPRCSPAVEELVATIDQSLDELEHDPDARRAVIRAYARMESVLGRHGLPRRPSEAPLEYLKRVLMRLDVGRPSARRLTDLFVQAKFSPHPIGPAMKEEAIGALTALRADLGGER